MALFSFRFWRYLCPLGSGITKMSQKIFSSIRITPVLVVNMAAHTGTATWPALRRTAKALSPWPTTNPTKVFSFTIDERTRRSNVHSPKTASASLTWRSHQAISHDEGGVSILDCNVDDIEGTGEVNQLAGTSHDGLNVYFENISFNPTNESKLVARHVETVEPDEWAYEEDARNGLVLSMCIIDAKTGNVIADKWDSNGCWKQLVVE